MEFIYFQIFAVGRDRDHSVLAGCESSLGRASTTHGQALATIECRFAQRGRVFTMLERRFTASVSRFIAPGHALVS